MSGNENKSSKQFLLESYKSSLAEARRRYERASYIANHTNDYASLQETSDLCKQIAGLEYDIMQLEKSNEPD